MFQDRIQIHILSDKTDTISRIRTIACILFKMIRIPIKFWKPKMHFWCYFWPHFGKKRSKNFFLLDNFFPWSSFISRTWRPLKVIEEEKSCFFVGGKLTCVYWLIFLHGLASSEKKWQYHILLSISKKVIPTFPTVKEFKIVWREMDVCEAFFQPYWAIMYVLLTKRHKNLRIFLKILWGGRIWWAVSN